MYSDTELTLADWARIIGIHPVHFAQVGYPTPRRCDQVFLQYPWQNRDITTRDEVAQAIHEAETLIERELNHFLTPRYVTNEYIRVPPYYQREYPGGQYDIRWLPLGIQTRWGELISGGVKATTTLEEGASITYSDEDEDGYSETATITVSVSELYDKCEIHVYRPGPDADPDPDNGKEVRPLTSVSPTASEITIKTRREYLVKSALYETFDPSGISYDDDDSFLSTVDVVREYLDPSDQATMLWEPFNACWACGSTGCEACAWQTQTACLIPRNPRTGSVGMVPAEWDEDEEQFNYKSGTFFQGLRPQLVKVNYRSGLPYEDSTCRLTGTWARAVAVFAASMLDRPPCGCAADAWEQWREDLSIRQGGDQNAQYEISKLDLNNPFGTRRGAVYAWRRVYDQRIAESTTLT